MDSVRLNAPFNSYLYFSSVKMNGGGPFSTQKPEIICLDTATNTISDAQKDREVLRSIAKASETKQPKK